MQRERVLRMADIDDDANTLDGTTLDTTGREKGCESMRVKICLYMTFKICKSYRASRCRHSEYKRRGGEELERGYGDSDRRC